jgi:hypothetical protein
MKKEYKEIWSAYIKAKQQFTERLAQDIFIKKDSCELRAGHLIAEIEQQKNENELLSIIKKVFKVPEADIHLDKGYFLMPNNEEVSEQTFTKFSEETDKFYLDFEPNPALEGFIKINKISNFYKELEKLGIDANIDRDNKINCTREQLNNLSLLLTNLNNFSIESVGCIYTFKSIGLFSIIKDFLDKQERDFFDIKQINNKIFKVICKHSSDKIKNKSLKLEQTIPFDLLQDLDIYFDSKIIEVRCIFKTEKITKDFLVFLNEKYNIHSLYENNLFEVIIKDIFSGYSILFNSLFFELNKVDKMTKLMSSEIYFESMEDLFDNFDFEKKQFSETIIQSMQYELPFPTYQINLLKQTISFDFQGFEDFEEKKSKILAIKGLKIADYKEKHKFKVKLCVANLFQKIQEKLIQKFPSIRCKTNRKNDELKVTFHYKYNHSSSKNELSFKNFIEQECEKEQFLWVLNPEIAYKLKFIAQVNEDKKAFEENEKFNRLLRNDIKVGDEKIGTLHKVDFPKLTIKLSRPVLEEELKNIKKLRPDLTGELEKDARLEDTIDKLEGDGKSLANPNIKFFIFDSKRAKPLNNPKILLPESEEWQEIKLHQNPKSNLNDSQIRGVLCALNADDLVIIQGPPGTGKSTAISEIIWHHIRTKAKQKILLTSESHLAVDNALDKLGTIPNGLVKPVRFGVDEDVFEETENQEESKIENEGKRYSYKRFKRWLNSDRETTPAENYQVLSDNAVQKWAALIGGKSIQQHESQQDIAIFLSEWRDILENPEQDLKQLFYDNYMANVNVVGATSSSIAEKSFTKAHENGNPKKGKFLREYDEVFFEPKKEKNKQTQKIKFDVIVTDEASKATPPELALPMLYGKKNIVVGDHRQLPPSLDENDFTTTLKNIGTSESRDLAEFFKNNKDEMNTSQFEKLFLGLDRTSSIRATFNQQYRMHSSINEVIKQFYIDDGGLFCGLDPEKENIADFSEPQSRWHGLEYPGFITPEVHCIWVNVDTPEIKDGTSRTNYGEIDACEQIIKILQNSNGFEEMQNYWKKEEDKEIGLISFYGTQVGKLGKMTQDKFPNLPIRVKTVDKFQGMERNLLIVSMVRSNKIANTHEQKPDFDMYGHLGFASQTSLGFAELPNRLNVALSRAKRLLIIVGNIAHFAQKDIYKNVYESIKNSPHGKIINNIQDFKL